VSRDVIFEEEIAFRRSRESQMEIDSEIVPSPPSIVQRETTIVPVNPVDPVAPVVVPRDITVGHKCLARLDKLYMRQRDMQLCFSHEPHH
jgi:hypothetical protein